MSSRGPESSVGLSAESPRPVAVIDVGTNSIRMAVAEIRADRQIHKLASFSQAVNLAHDTFRTGSIRRATIEQCVRVLTVYRQALKEYQIESPDQVRVVATSAVREARNRLVFTDRIYIATGLLVEPIDEAEVNRVTYRGIRPFVGTDSPLGRGQTIVVEVGGGNTELLMLAGGDVEFANTYRLGSVRLRVALEAMRARPSELRRVMENQIMRTVDVMYDRVAPREPPHLLALGSDMRFAAGLICPGWAEQRIVSIPSDELRRLADEFWQMREDDIVQRFHLSYPDAETLAPTLLAYSLMAQRFGLDELWISDVNLRDGLLHEMAIGDAWTEDFRRQVVQFAMALARRYRVDEQHAQQVANLSQQLFEQLYPLHRLESRYSVLLYLAALLHEIGAYVNTRSLHKHTMYLIRNSELFGLGQKDQLLVALIARYHRRASPQSSHEGYSTLDREDRITVAKLAAILRIAIALDESRSGRISELTCEVDDERVIIYLYGVQDIALERLAVRQQSNLFDEVFGRAVLLRTDQS